MAEIRVHVGSLGCRRCVRKVTARLRDIPGVQLVIADVDTGVIILQGDMTKDGVLRALADSQYQSSVVDDPTVST